MAKNISTYRSLKQRSEAPHLYRYILFILNYLQILSKFVRFKNRQKKRSSFPLRPHLSIPVTMSRLFIHLMTPKSWTKVSLQFITHNFEKRMCTFRVLTKILSTYLFFQVFHFFNLHQEKFFSEKSYFCLFPKINYKAD